MMIRRLVAILNIGLFVVAFVSLYYLPQYSTVIFYGLLLWMFASLFLFFGRSMDRPIGGRPAPPPSGAPLVSGPPTTLDFCVYCGTPLSRGASTCPACGKTASPV
jgi:zinc-ribbon domain